MAELAIVAADAAMTRVLPQGAADSSPDRVCQLTLPSPEAMLPLIDQHRAIVTAIDARDEDAAAEAMRRHLTEILRALPRVEAENPELFSA